MEINLENLYVDQLGLVNAGNNSWGPLPDIHLLSWCYKIPVFSLDFSPSVLPRTTLLSMEVVSLLEKELKFSPFS